MRLETMLRAAIFLVTAGLVMTGKGGTAFGQDSPQPCRYIPAYHEIYDRTTGKRVDIARTGLDALLADVLSCVTAQLTRDETSMYDAAVREAAWANPNSKLSRWTQSIFRILLADSISTSPEIGTQAAVANRILQQLGTSIATVLDSEGSTVTESIRRKHRTSKVQTGEMATYINDCVKSGVIVPETLADFYENDQGTGLGHEIENYILGRDKDLTRIWAKKTTNGGMCVTLLRAATDQTKTPPLGTICVDEMQTSACFFDNLVIKDNKPAPLPLQQAFMTPLKDLLHPRHFAASNELGQGSDRCSACHRGQNPFIVHPRLALGKAIRDHYSEAYKNSEQSAGMFAFVPVAGASGTNSWQNDRKMELDGKEKIDGARGACMKCHNLPAFGKSHAYARDVIRFAMENTMPPSKNCTGPENNKDCVGWPKQKDGGYCFPKTGTIAKPFFKSARTLAHLFNAGVKAELGDLPPDPGGSKSADCESDE